MTGNQLTRWLQAPPQLATKYTNKHLNTHTHSHMHTYIHTYIQPLDYVFITSDKTTEISNVMQVPV